VVAVNVLNVADALLTAFAVRIGEAVESNPVVRLIALPAKVILVGLMTVLLARRNPAVLIWPAIVLLGVVGWHLAGLAVRP
jgi:hypothetical protein